MPCEREIQRTRPRPDGQEQRHCLDASHLQRALAMPFGVNHVTGRPGPAPSPARDNDRQQARQRINVEVRSGRRLHPNVLPCTDCGHIWKQGERRHEYDHHLGYAPENHLSVQSVCTSCHKKRTIAAGEIGQRRMRGEKWCTGCKAWHSVSEFGKDRGRNDGLMVSCRATEAIRAKEKWERTRKSRGLTIPSTS